MHLDARYTVLTNDKSYIYVRAKGLYRPGPETGYFRSIAKNPHQSPPAVVTQDDVEFFSHLQLEAGRGRYNWLNGLVCIGVMSCVGTRIVIDAYYLTNFRGVRPESVMMRKD